MKDMLLKNRVMDKIEIDDYQAIIEILKQIVTFISTKCVKKNKKHNYTLAAVDYPVEVFRHYRKTIDLLLSENANSTKELMALCQSISIALQKELEKESIGAHERARIENRMMQVLIYAEKNIRRSNKERLVIGLFAGGLVDLISVAIVAPLTANAMRSSAMMPV